MSLKQLFARKSLETLHEEMQGDNRLRRVLGPIGLTSLGVGAIIGAGIFVMTGRVAAQDAGPAILISFGVAGFACALAAFCYAEFAAMAPVAGSAYTYAYATLGELFAWIIGWDLILEYAMSCATVAASWSKYLNEFTLILFDWQVPEYLCSDPFSQHGAWFNLPAVLILALVTVILVIGIRESAASNAVLVLVKLAVVLFVIAVGASYVSSANWTKIPEQDRILAERSLLHSLAHEEAKKRNPADEEALAKQLGKQALAAYMVERVEQVNKDLLGKGKLTEAEVRARVATVKKAYGADLPLTAADREAVAAIIAAAREEAPSKEADKWGLLGKLGLNRWLVPIDDSVRSPFIPYGFSGLMLGAAIVFFAFIGFDSISTHSEEARNPQRDVPIGILTSLFLCTLLYIAVAAVITGMQPYPTIDPDAAVAAAFRERGEAEGGNSLLKAAAGLIATGALAGMTSVLLITFLSQARIFLAMSRDGLLPASIFGAVHEKFKTPHLSTMLTGGFMCVVTAFTPILILEDMVNIGTLFAFVVVCAAVLILRITRPDARRPFRCPLVFVVAPLGIVANLILMLFLPWDTWLRLVIWLIIGLVIYFVYGMRNSALRKRMAGGV
jgi:APA family basic amino acid/polyamine antiporter